MKYSLILMTLLTFALSGCSSTGTDMAGSEAKTEKTAKNSKRQKIRCAGSSTGSRIKQSKCS